MVREVGRSLVAVLLLGWPSAVLAQNPPEVAAAEAARPPGGRLLEVPYVAQSADLCGGAALAMVLRYWGDERALAEDFAGLVDPEQGGIRTGRLVEAARARGWNSRPLIGATDELVRSHVARGRPTIALIEERRGVLHYVVIVAWTATHIVAHDPARTPFRTFTRDEFDRRWAVSDRWLLLVLPGQESQESSVAVVSPSATAEGMNGGATDSVRTGLAFRTPGEASRGETVAGRGPGLEATASAPTRCDGLLTHGIRLAAARDLPAAERTLIAATESCPLNAAAWQELAGVRFLQQDWADAERLAARAVAMAPADPHGWRLLAAARYQQSHWSDALRAMAVTDEPRIDLIEVSGATRTPHPLIIEASGLSPGGAFTAREFDRAARRLAALPIAFRSRLSFRPTGTGSTMTVEAAIAERDGWPRRWTDWAGIAARAAATETLRLDLAGPVGAGELVTGLWRWSEPRRMVGFRLATLAPGRLPGVAVVEGTWERQTYGAASGELVAESRRRVGLLLTDWASGALRWEAEAALERFGADHHVAFGGALEKYARADRLAVRGEASAWAGPNARRFATAGIDFAVRTRASEMRPVLAARSGLFVASSGAPLALWPGAGTGRARPGLLRAHPLLSRDVLTGEVFGRRLWHGTIEYARPVWVRPMATVALRVFADAARAWRTRHHSGAPSTAHVDVGGGVRIRTPGIRGSLELSLAYGTRDGRTALSAGFAAPWPRFDDWRER